MILKATASMQTHKRKHISGTHQRSSGSRRVFTAHFKRRQRVMRLSDFIAASREPILAEWEAFARKAKPANDSKDIASLRAHASESSPRSPRISKPDGTSMSSF
jgi:hypothetical protein